MHTPSKKVIIQTILGMLFVVMTFSFINDTAYAHEVYVLSPETVASVLASPSDNPFSAIRSNEMEFFTWGFISVMIISIVFLVSIIRPLEQILEPVLFDIKRKFGFIVVRATIGLSLIASGWYGALFGPELPLTQIFGVYAPIISTLLIGTGICILIGFFTRIMGILALLIALYGVYTHGMYMLTYSNYIGDIVFVAFLGAHIWSIDKHLFRWQGVMGIVERFIEKYAFLMLRLTFGFSLIYASVFAKFLHSDLALRTVTDYNLTDYFHFAPLFIVLGAGIVEITIGIFIMIGFEVRFTALFLMCFLTLSLLYFGEAVWPHIVLFGGALALFIHGYDRYTIEGFFFKNAEHEPIL